MSNEKKLWNRKRVAVPTTLQMEAVECGAASLSMILAHFGRYVPLEELRVEAGVSRDGSKANNLLKAARKYGLEAKGYKCEVDGIRQYPLPMIVFWNFNHFLVLEGIKGNTVYLNDPASGPREIPFEEFKSSYTDVLLTFKPTAEFRRAGTPPSILKSLAARGQGLGWGLFFVFLTVALQVIPGLVIPAFSAIFLDDVLIRGAEGWFKPLMVAMGIMFLINASLTWLQQYYLLRINTRLAVTGARSFVAHLLQLPVEFFLQREPAEINSRVATNDRVAQLLSGQTASSLVNILMIGLYLPVMYYFDHVLTWVGVTVVFGNLVTLKVLSAKRVILNARIQKDLGKVIGHCGTGIQSLETLKATGSEDDFFSQWAGHHTRMINANQEMSVFNQLMTSVPSFLNGVGNVLVLCVGCLRVMDGHLTVGSLVGFQALFGNFVNPVIQLVMMGSTLQMVEADLARLDDVMRYKADPRFVEHIPAQPGETGGAAPTTKKKGLVVQEKIKRPKLKGELELRNLTFGYSRLEPPLLTDFSMVLKPGSRIALVGGSGSGKSTAARLVTSLYPPWSGEILFDGKPLGDVPRYLFANSLSLVDQDIALFRGTIKQNIQMWDSTIPDEDVVRAAKDACIHEVIAERSGGYDSLLEEGGGNFSGGQRQRLEIARALASNPTLLVLDEATSALDPLTEKTIDENLRRRGCSCLIIAHRLSTIRDADEIIVLDKGKIVERGTHDELCQKDGAYARLIKMH